MEAGLSRRSGDVTSSKTLGDSPVTQSFRRASVAPVSAHSEDPYEALVPTVADCLAVLEQAYPPRWAESWDAVGLSVGE